MVLYGGEKGIRTLDTFRYTRFPGARVRPDYATSPFGYFGRVENFTINSLDREGKEIFLTERIISIIFPGTFQGCLIPGIFRQFISYCNIKTTKL